MIKNLEDVDFWRGLNPELDIDSKNGSVGIVPFGEVLLSQTSDHLLTEGYFQLPPLIDAALVSNLAQAMFRLKENDIPPVYIYLYDQAWEAFACLQEFLKRFLGEEVALLPNFWAWHLDTELGASGWPPHKDCQADTVFKLGKDEQIYMSLSLWIPLTDVTEENGCMVVLPKSVEQSYSPAVKSIEDIDLSDGRKLPAKAGSVLGWTQELYHWSNQVTKHVETPRISLSLEFQNTGFDPLGKPLLDISRPPSFAERLDLINQQFKKYAHME